jgi:hypothetical protein
MSLALRFPRYVAHVPTTVPALPQVALGTKRTGYRQHGLNYRLSHLAYATAASVRTDSSPPSPPQTKRVNGPSTTLPAPLTTPTRSPDQRLPSHLFAIGKAYLAFYKAGARNIYSNWKSAARVEAVVDGAPYGGSVVRAVRAGALDRHDFLLLGRSRFDVARVPAFGLVLLVCGEFTPLVVVAFTNVVPYPCRIPRQIDGYRRKLEARRATSFRNLTIPPPEAEGLETLVRMQLWHISSSLGLCSSWWDWLYGPPTWWLRRNVARRLEFLELDDELIVSAGGLGDMSDQEVELACVARGIDIVGRQATMNREHLQQWLDATHNVSRLRLLLTR